MKGHLLRAVHEGLGLLPKSLSRTCPGMWPTDENTSEQLKCVSVQGGGTQQCPRTASPPGTDVKAQQSRVWPVPVVTGQPGEAACAGLGWDRVHFLQSS